METRPLVDISEENQRRVAAKMARLDLLRPLTYEDHMTYVRLDLESTMAATILHGLNHDYSHNSRRKVA